MTLTTRDAVVDEPLLEPVDRRVATRPRGARHQAVNADDEHVLVVRPVEDPDLPGLGEGLPDPPQEVVGPLLGGRRPERGDPHPLRVTGSDDVLDDAALASGVHALDDQQSAAVATALRRCGQPLLQVGQPHGPGRQRGPAGLLAAGDPRRRTAVRLGQIEVRSRRAGCPPDAAARPASSCPSWPYRMLPDLRVARSGDGLVGSGDASVPGLGSARERRRPRPARARRAVPLHEAGGRGRLVGAGGPGGRTGHRLRLPGRRQRPDARPPQPLAAARRARPEPAVRHGGVHLVRRGLARTARGRGDPGRRLLRAPRRDVHP